MDSHRELLNRIKENLPNLKALLEEVNGHWYYEDLIYRFYHQSFKVYRIQEVTQKIVDTLKKLVPENETINPFFEEILREGASGKKFEYEHNNQWLRHARPMVEAFFHAKYFLEMAVKYGDLLETPPQVLPSGWAGLLYLYNLR